MTGPALSFVWPMIVPYYFTLSEAASSPSTQAFLMVGAFVPAPDHPDVFRLVVLGVPRKSAQGHRLPLRSSARHTSTAIFAGRSSSKIMKPTEITTRDVPGPFELRVV
jgi:hypothetical protein